MTEPRYLLAEDLLLLLLDDESGSLLADQIAADAGVAGALLLELALRDRVRLHEHPGLLAKQVVRVSDASATGDELLDHALAVVAEKDRTATGVVERLAPGLRRALLDRLEHRGLVEHDEGRVLGVFPRHRWPAQDTEHELGLRADLRASLVGDVPPSEHTGALVALLHAIGAEHRVLAFPGRSHRELRARAAELTELRAWAGTGAHDVIDAIRAAVVATTVAAASASPGGG